MKRIKDRDLQAALCLTDGDIEKIRDAEATWNAKTEEFIPSRLSLFKLIREIIRYQVGIDELPSKGA
jgi:hypothetical protein